MTNTELFLAAEEKWGRALQLVMALEETAELQKEVCKIIRGDISNSRMESLASEIADVQLMCEQLTFMYELESRVSGEKTYKLKRLQKLLSQPYKQEKGENDNG